MFRVCFAGFAARRLGPGLKQRVGNSWIEGWKAQGSNAYYVSLDDAAKELKITLRSLSDGTYLKFNRNGRAYELFLAADKFKINGVLKDLPDITMVRDGKWFVPLQVIKL